MNSAARPRVSVVIPSYNHAPFVGQAIESVLTDAADDVELIIADDASTDGSRRVIAHYRDDRLRLIELPRNAGTSAALNAGIKTARGDYISVLASDDFFLPGTLQKQMDFLERHPQYDGVFGMPRMVDEASRPLNVGYGEFMHPFIGREASRADWLRRFFLSGNCLCHPTAMLRKRVHETIGLYDRRLLNLSDLDLWVRMLVHGFSFFVLPDELTARRIRDHQKNLSAPSVATHLRSTFEYIQVLKIYRRLPALYLYQVFANEIRSAGIGNNLTTGGLLAEIASRSTFRPLQLFALDGLYEELGADPGADCSALFRLAGRLDPFSVVGNPVLGPEVPQAQAGQPSPKGRA